MRSIQRNPVARAGVACLFGAAVSVVAWHTFPFVVAVLLFACGFILLFVFLTIAPDLIALQRKHYWRWWWRSSNDEGPFWPGTRIPRHLRQ